MVAITCLIKLKLKGNTTNYINKYFFIQNKLIEKVV